MKNTIFTGALFFSLLSAKVGVVASTTDLADIASIVGGDRIRSVSIARGAQDPHYIEVLPSYMIKVKRADIYLKVGMELDRWAQQIIDGSRNRKLIIIDCSKNIPKLEVPTEKIDASKGHIHRYGNPHYWLDPENGKIIALTISEALSQVDPKGRKFYEQNLRAFSERTDEQLKIWNDQFSDLRGRKLIFYHNSWPYFATRFGLEMVEFIEPTPGIMPTPGHLEKLISVIKDQKIKLVAMQPYYSDKAPKYLAEKTGVEIVKMAPSVKARKPATSYLEMFNYNLEVLKEALK